MIFILRINSIRSYINILLSPSFSRNHGFEWRHLKNEGTVDWAQAKKTYFP